MRYCCFRFLSCALALLLTSVAATTAFAACSYTGTNNQQSTVMFDGTTISYCNSSNNWTAAATSLSQWITSGSTIYYTAGNVGIGTTNPGYPLTVNGNILALNAYLSQGGNAGFSTYDRTTSGNGVFYRTGGVNRLWDSSAGDVIVYNGSGFVGIGESSYFNGLLNFTGNATTTILAATRTDGTQLGYLQTNGWGGWNLSSSLAIGYTLPNSIQTEMVVNGNVGIGTATPAAKLEIGGGGTDVVVIQNTAIFGARDTNGTIQHFLYGRWNDNALYMDGGVGGLNLRVNNGNNQVLNLSAANENATFTATVYDSDGAIHSSSDGRLKKDIVPLQGASALDVIDQLNPVRYRWINPELHGKIAESGGFVAQDVQKIMPHLVEQTDCHDADCPLVDGGKEYTLGFKPEFFAYLVKAVQELKAENDRSRAQNDVLAARVKALEDARR